MKLAKISPILFLMLLAIPASAQLRNPKKLAKLSTPLQERLIERLNLYIEYDRTGQYDKQYDLLSNSYIERMKLNKESYPKTKIKWGDTVGVLLEFKAKYIDVKLNHNMVVMAGEARIIYKGRKVFQAANITAYLQNDEWYFDVAFIEI
jgi:hypothetical protein